MSKQIMNYIFYPLVFIVGLCGTASAQQEDQFTQFMYNKLALNPAYPGVRGIPSLTALYRRQWMGFKGAPENKLLSFDAPLFADKVGIGLVLNNQTLGIMNNWFVNMAYSYHIKISEESSFRFGLQGSVKFQSLDFSDPGVFIRDENDMSIMANETTRDIFVNFGPGIYYTYKSTYIGLSVPYLYPGEIGFNRDPSVDQVAESSPHYYGMAGTSLPLSSTLQLRPSILCKYVKNAPFDLDINLMLAVNYKFNVGVSYRMGGDGAGDSFDLLAMYQYNQMAFGLAYDISLSNLNNHSSGSLEALIRYDFVKEREDMANPRFFF